MPSYTYIYGAGGMGREVLTHCRSIGKPVHAFIDRAASTLVEVDGLPVVDLAAFDRPNEGEVLVALHSPGADVAGVVANLQRRGWAEVTTLWKNCREEAWRPDSAFWLDPFCEWDDHRDAIAHARRLMQDDHSRQVFDEQLRLREFGDYAGLSIPSTEDQYVPHNLPRWRDPMRLVDCGAFDGDTVRLFAAGGYLLESVIAIEPDPANFARLEAAPRRSMHWRAIRAGVHSTSGRMTFAADGAGSAHLDACGAVTIDVVRIDDICRDVAPSLIKMDIEGAERDALEGARETLARCRPDLAISAYHHPDDLWRLPLQIDAWKLGYGFDLRSHAHNGFDTVLYATAHR